MGLRVETLLIIKTTFWHLASPSPSEAEPGSDSSQAEVGTRLGGGSQRGPSSLGARGSSLVPPPSRLAFSLALALRSLREKVSALSPFKTHYSAALGGRPAANRGPWGCGATSRWLRRTRSASTSFQLA